MSSVRLSAEERRQALVDAALRVFHTTSYAGATTAEIAREAGVSEPILYRHFPSKRALYVACLEQSWEQLRSAWIAARTGAAPDQWLQAVSNATIALADGGTVLPPTLWLQAFAEAGHDDEIRGAIRRVMREVHDTVAATIARAQREQAVDPERDPSTEAWNVVASLLLHTVSRRVGGLLSRADADRLRSERLRWLGVA
jgi:AcrR family transcriptional regulator